MERLLDIIIPMYNTPKEYITRALNSINKQKGIDFKSIGVIIIDDCSSKIKYKKSWFKQSFPKLQITYIINKENVGPGVSRQNGIDISEAKYITFLDSDDEFYGFDSFSKVLSIFNEYDIDKITTKVNEEIIVNNSLCNISHDPVTLNSLHGLFVRRQFLIDNNIRFDDKLRIHEDFYFVRLLNGFAADSRAFIDQITYNWKWNSNSLMRSQKERYNHLEDEIYAIFKTNEIFENAGVDYLSQYISGMCTLYLLLASNLFDFEEYKQLKPRYLDLFLKYYNKDKFNMFGLDKLNERIKKKYDDLFRCYPWMIIKEDFNSFLKNNKLEAGN